ncbi:serine--tRNA ligase [Flavobacteriaceae bacterium]|jgi:seryl-tRNA synthetase|nr:serine--tRNA ligase [Flavobacteriaceae bacterium]MDA9551715.1 serine--tRNA ligase [Flavobacteriaceae bacterium]MDB2612242.1 serine--tRNA ligase [Flavobacteriaceae bacterium]MDC0956754.1 serine--tRNA ligase [Flavobacteriaceae bacterium]MDG1378657.1 serine--tRNA ligase [Flavobacteriaceae bacterium]|tara:strand:+ start:498 stop:1775 length:1278 start_codon:yes stop_codon:yes gene_type:complete
MLQVPFIRDHQELIVNRLKKRNIDASKMIANVIEFDEERRQIQTELDNTLAESNTLSKEIGLLYKTGNIDEANLIKEKTVELKVKSKHLTERLNTTSEGLKELLYMIPNVPNEIVPSGNTEEDNEIVFQGGSSPELSKNALPHWDLAKKYDIIDFELGNKIAGAGFPVYKDKGARLQRALINYFLDKNVAAGYKEVQVPHLVNEESGYGTGQLPDKEGQMYHVNSNGDNLYLIPTAEVPATNLFRDDLLSEKDLPKAITAYTPCFRREAGSYGAHVRGLNRLHQFDKVEILRIEHPETSYQALDAMVSHIKDILEDLKLPYRILKLCGGDLGFTSALTYDFEVFSTAQGRWLEVSSVSNFETFQANRLKLRFKNSKGKSELAHTLNGSSLALPRILAGILENYQVDEGVKIPDVLIPYTGFSMIQ